MERRDGIELGALRAEVVRKPIKHVHLAVYPPDGRVRISAPTGMALDTIRLYALSRLNWIKSQQRKLRAQARETAREYLDRESHDVWGRRYLLKNVHAVAAPQVVLKHATLELHTRPGSDAMKRHEVLQAWYREQIRSAVPALLATWEPRLGIKAQRVLVQQMKTRWGSCNPASGIIRLNTDLARKPPDCLEYVLVHELVHLLEPTHNARFQALMGDAMPRWRQARHDLNRLPLCHVAWP